MAKRLNFLFEAKDCLKFILDLYLWPIRSKITKSQTLLVLPRQDGKQGMTKMGTKREAPGVNVECGL